METFGGGSIDYDARRRVSFSDDDTTFFYNDNLADDEPHYHEFHDNDNNTVTSDEVGNELELESDSEMVKLIDHNEQDKNNNIASDTFKDDAYHDIDIDIDDDNDNGDDDRIDMMNVIRESASNDVEMARQRVFQEVLGSLRRTRSSALDRARRGMTDLEEYYESELDMVRSELARKRKEQADAVAELQDLKDKFKYDDNGHYQKKKTTLLLKDTNNDNIDDSDKSNSVAIEKESYLECIGGGTLDTREEKQEEIYKTSTNDENMNTMQDIQEHGAKHESVSGKASNSASPYTDSLNQDIIAQLQLTIRARDDEITALLNDNTNLQSQIIAEKQSYHDNDKMKDSRFQNESLQYTAELKRLNTTIATYEQEQNDNQQSISKMENRIATLEEEAQAHKKTIEKATVARNLLEQENENFRRRIDALKLELSSEAKNGAEATRKLIIYEESLKELQAKYKTLKESALSFQPIDDQIDKHSVNNNSNNNSNVIYNNGRFRVEDNDSSSVSRRQHFANVHDDDDDHVVDHIKRQDTVTYGHVQRSSNMSQNSTQARQLLENSLSDVIDPTKRISKTKMETTGYHHGGRHNVESLPETTTTTSIHIDRPQNISFAHNNDTNDNTTQKRLFVNEQSLYSTNFRPDASEEALHNKENNEENSIPFATEVSLRASMELTAAIERELMALNQEQDQLETLLAKLPLNAGKTLAQRRRKIDTEERLEIVKKSIAKLRMKMRRMHVL